MTARPLPEGACPAAANPLGDSRDPEADVNIAPRIHPVVIAAGGVLLLTAGWLLGIGG